MTRTVKTNARKGAGSQSTVETLYCHSASKVARKGRTSAREASSSRVTARSSKISRKGACGQDERGTLRVPATGKVARKSGTAAVHRSTPSAASSTPPNISSRAATHSDGQPHCVFQSETAVVTSSALHHVPDIHNVRERATPRAALPMPADQREPIASINDAWRKRQGIVRAMTKLSLQAQATLRSGRDREEAAKHYAVVAKDPTHIDYPIIAPYLEAQAPLAGHRASYEKTLVKLVKQLPIYKWAEGVSGLGEVSLSGLVGECSGFNAETNETWSIGQMKSVSALWKRMGVAVVGGIRQQRVKGDAAIEHGYVAERRAVLWNIGECIVKAQWRKENTVHAYGKLYGEIKATMQERNEAGYYAESALAIADRMKKAGSKPNPENADGRLTAMHINNRAKRHVTKRLLRDLFVEWRRLDAEARGETYAPLAEAA